MTDFVNRISAKRESDPGRAPRLAERRSFLGIAIGVITASIASVLGVTIGKFSAAPAFSSTAESRWADAGLLADIPEGKPVKRSVVVSQNAGWGRFNTQRLVWIVRDGVKVKVFSAACPHLGCTINEARSGFVCPCHGSAWNAQGQRLGGPTPRGMDSLEFRISGDVLQVRYQYFKQGLPGKDVVS